MLTRLSNDGPCSCNCLSGHGADGLLRALARYDGSTAELQLVASLFALFCVTLELERLGRTLGGPQ